MSGPANIPATRRDFQSLDGLVDSIGGAGWDALQGALAPAAVPDNYRPDDDVMKSLAIMAERGETRAVVEWLLDLTLRAPYPVTADTLEQTALAAAKHQARANVGEVVLKAIAEGRAKLERKD